MDVDKTERKRTRNGTSKKSKKRKVEATPSTLTTTETTPREELDTVATCNDGGATANSKKGSNGRKASSRVRVQSVSEEEVPELTKRKRTRINILKPRQNMDVPCAGNVVYQLVYQAVRNIKFDPRQHPDSVNWSFWARDVLDGDNVAKIWWYITKEYPESSLQDILAQLEPYNKSTYHDLRAVDVKKSYAGECPKPPVTAYLQFIQEKGPKLKKEKPELSAKEITKELAKQWSCLGTKQERYKKKYTNARAEYDLKLQEFYERHPEAKPQRRSAKAKALKPRDFEIKENDAVSEKIRKLKKIAPKQATPPFMLFCADKRREFHDKNPDLSSTEITALLGNTWNQLTPMQKKKYIDLHEKKAREREVHLKAFYELYPEAEELLKTKRKRKTSKESDVLLTTTTTDINNGTTETKLARGSDKVEDKIKAQTRKLKSLYMQQELTSQPVQQVTDDEDSDSEDEEDSGKEEASSDNVENQDSSEEEEEESDDSEEESDNGSSSDSDSS